VIQRFAIYDPATGSIISTGNCPDTQLAVQPQAGQAVIPIDETVTAQTHKVVGGEVVPI